MSIKSVIQHSLGMSDRAVGMYLGDLPAEAFFVRPVGGMNHLALQLGHLISVERRLVESVKPGASPSLPDGFDEQHDLKKHDVDDPAAFLTKDEYMALWKSQRAATVAALESMSEADLAAENTNERSSKMCPTVGSVLNLCGMHALLHSGQFVAVRRMKEMPIAF